MGEKQTAKSHIYRDDFSLPCEDVILSEFLSPGMNVLDIGCAASGRSARVLKKHGVNVYSIELNHDAIAEFSRRPDSQGIELITADMTKLPFQDQFFDMVMIAYHGLDYLNPESLRISAIRESARVLKKNGQFVFNTLNPVGVIASPRHIYDLKYLIWRAKQILKLGFLKSTLIDSHGIEMFQGSPRTVINQIQHQVNLKFLYIISQKSTIRNKFLISLFSSGPYYVFSKT